jgi:hypothetical protein
MRIGPYEEARPATYARVARVARVDVGSGA